MIHYIIYSSETEARPSREGSIHMWLISYTPCPFLPYNHSIASSRQFAGTVEKFCNLLWWSIEETFSKAQSSCLQSIGPLLRASPHSTRPGRSYMFVLAKSCLAPMSHCWKCQIPTAWYNMCLENCCGTREKGQSERSCWWTSCNVNRKPTQQSLRRKYHSLWECLNTAS